MAPKYTLSVTSPVTHENDANLCDTAIGNEHLQGHDDLTRFPNRLTIDQASFQNFTTQWDEAISRLSRRNDPSTSETSTVTSAHHGPRRITTRIWDSDFAGQSDASLLLPRADGSHQNTCSPALTTTPIPYTEPAVPRMLPTGVPAMSAELRNMLERMIQRRMTKSTSSLRLSPLMTLSAASLPSLLRVNTFATLKSSASGTTGTSRGTARTWISRLVRRPLEGNVANEGSGKDDDVSGRWPKCIITRRSTEFV
jgi:hypothetical protein